MSKDPFADLLTLLVKLDIIKVTLARKLYNEGYNKYSY